MLSFGIVVTWSCYWGCHLACHLACCLILSSRLSYGVVVNRRCHLQFLSLCVSIWVIIRSYCHYVIWSCYYCVLESRWASGLSTGLSYDLVLWVVIWCCCHFMLSSALPFNYLNITFILILKPLHRLQLPPSIITI
jgi:hypothetical protein